MRIPLLQLQLDLPGLANVTHVVLRGRPDSRGAQYVTGFALLTSKDGRAWERYLPGCCGGDAMAREVAEVVGGEDLTIATTAGISTISSNEMRSLARRSCGGARGAARCAGCRCRGGWPCATCV